MPRISCRETCLDRTGDYANNWVGYCKAINTANTVIIITTWLPSKKGSNWKLFSGGGAAARAAMDEVSSKAMKPGKSLQTQLKYISQRFKKCAFTNRIQKAGFNFVIFSSNTNKVIAISP